MHNINLIDLYFVGQLLDILSPMNASSSSFYYVASEDLKFAPQLAIQADAGREWATCLVTTKEPNPWFKIEFKSTTSIFNVRLGTKRQTRGQLPADYGMDGLSVYVSHFKSWEAVMNRVVAIRGKMTHHLTLSWTVEEPWKEDLYMLQFRLSHQRICLSAALCLTEKKVL